MNRVRIFSLVLVVVAAACSTSSSPSTTVTAPPATDPPPSTATSLPEEVVGTIGSPGLTDTYYPDLGNGGYDAQSYTVAITWDPSIGILTGTTTMVATATQNLTTFYLDFGDLEIVDIAVDGMPASAGKDNPSSINLAVEPERTIATGATFEVVTTYTGVPATISSVALPIEAGWTIAPDGTSYVVTEPDGAYSWFPVNDHPLDKALFRFEITIPEGLSAAANGVYVDTITDIGSNTWIWEGTQPMAPYLATVVVGDIEIVEDVPGSTLSGIPIRNILPLELATNPPPALALQGEMLSFFASVLGPYPFATYGIASVEGFEAALENQTLSIFGADIMRSGFLETVLVHEIAHQWIGNSVSLADWSDIWLNEGFATYAEWLWEENQRGPQARDALIDEAYATVESLTPLAPGTPPPDDLFAFAVYNRGGLTLHALRQEVGDDMFFAILETYVTRFTNGNARTADFVAIAEEVSGEDLGSLFDRWLYQTELPPLP
jgi:aminopeptidase N